MSGWGKVVLAIVKEVSLWNMRVLMNDAKERDIDVKERDMMRNKKNKITL